MAHSNHLHTSCPGILANYQFVTGEALNYHYLNGEPSDQLI